MKKLVIPVFLVLLLAIGWRVYAQDPEEGEKIQYLIVSVESLKGAVFIRNGIEYDTKAAADHLRLKLKYAGGRVKTAGDFIRLCGSRSSLSGEPYMVRFADGTILRTETYFQDRLKSFVPLQKNGVL